MNQTTIISLLLVSGFYKHRTENNVKKNCTRLKVKKIKNSTPDFSLTEKTAAEFTI